MVKAELGVKRLCVPCGVRFYDLKRSPIICPGCGAEFDPEKPVKSRKGRAVQKAAGEFVATTVDADDDVDLTDDDLDENDEEMIVSKQFKESDDDIDVDFDDDIDVDDDSSGVIEDDLDDDELLPKLQDKDE